jgi:L-threonylcarbamoyladenylate synthase
MILVNKLKKVAVLSSILFQARCYCYHYSTNGMYKSLLIEPDTAGIKQAAELLKNGELVAFPTETVYGLGANALNVNAVLNIFKAKGRPLTDPLIVHIANPEAAKELIEISSPEEEKAYQALTDSFWPGPLTIIMKASPLIPPPVTANTGFVGIRCPNHKLARLLIEQSTVPVAAPSANRFGHVSPTRAEHVLADLGAKGVRVLNGESSSHSLEDSPCQFGIESTVLKLDGANHCATIFRQGAITQRQIESVFHKFGIGLKLVALSRAVKMHKEEEENESDSRKNAEENDQSHKDTKGEVAPGQAVTHYAPDVPCFIIKSLKINNGNDHPSSSNSGSSNINNNSSSASSSSHTGENSRILRLPWTQIRSEVVLIDYGGKYSSLLSDKVLAYRDLSIEKDSLEAARNLFDTLRWSESIPNAKYVLVAPIEKKNHELIDEQKQLIEEIDSNENENENENDMSLGVADRVFRAASGVLADIVIGGNDR